MQHHLYKEPQAGNDYPLPEAQDHVEIWVDEFAELEKSIIDNYKKKHEMRPLIIFTLGFTAGFVWALLSGIFSRLV
jgi:hypothetical protein